MWLAKLLASAEPAGSGDGSGSSDKGPSGLTAVRPIKASALSNNDPVDKRYDRHARSTRTLVPRHLSPNGPRAALRTIDARIKRSPGDQRFHVSRALILVSSSGWHISGRSSPTAACVSNFTNQVRRMSELLWLPHLGR